MLFIIFLYNIVMLPNLVELDTLEGTSGSVYYNVIIKFYLRQ